MDVGPLKRGHHLCIGFVGSPRSVGNNPRRQPRRALAGRSRRGHGQGRSLLLLASCSWPVCNPSCVTFSPPVPVHDSNPVPLSRPSQRRLRKSSAETPHRSFIGAGEAVEIGQAWSGCPLTPLRTVRESFRSHGSRLYPCLLYTSPSPRDS